MSTDLEDMKQRMAAISGQKSKKKLKSTEPVTSLKKVESAKNRKDSRAKGSFFERAVAKRWSKWSGLEIRRTPMSGGWSHSAKFGVSGDLVCDNKHFPFHVECKNHLTWFIDDIITGVRDEGTTSIHQWWLQCLKTCPPKKTPVLLFKRNHRPVLMMMKATDWDAISKLCSFTIDFVPTLKAYMDDGDVVILTEDQFLSKVPYNKDLRLALRRK